MMKKKKQSRSQSSTKKTLEPSPDSSPRLLSIFRSKLVSGKDLKHMFRGMKTKTAPGLSSQSRIVRCPKCHKLLQEPIDATIYKCSGCDSILQAKRWDLESNGNSIPEALLYSQNRSLTRELESAEDGSKTPMRASPSVERGYHSETVYKHETSDIHREWMRRADEFSVTGDSDAFASARSSPYNSRSNASEWTQHERRYQETPRVPFYPASPSPSSAYEYGYNSPFHGSQASASEQSYYHHQPNQFKHNYRESWFQESSAASPIRFPGETSDGKYYHSSSQPQPHDPRYHNLYVPSSSSATSHRSVYSQRSYQADTAQHRSTYSEHSKSGTSSEKISQRDKKKNVRKKNHVVKRYVLPSAGGAPFATCSYCLELLQLPQVSHHGNHNRYQVRCGSCTGVLKFSVREKADNVLDSPSFAQETVTNHQDSASEGHEEIYPDDSHMSCSDNGSGDRICRSNDNDVILKRSISNTFLDSKLEALQPSMNREQQHTSTESIGDTSGNHLEQSEEACSEKSTEMDTNNISERVSCDLEEARYEKNETLKPERMFGDGSGEHFVVPGYKNERMSDSNIEAETETAADTHSGEYVCETRVLSENTGDAQEFGWEETQETEEYGGEVKREDITGDKSGLILEKSHCSSSNGEIYEDTAIKEDTEHKSAATQNENQTFIGHPDQSGEATVTTSRIHEQQSKYEYENLRERQELDKAISDSVRYELEESSYDTNKALDTDKLSEDGPVVSLTKASETFKTSVEGENVENSYERLEHAGERTWAETLEDRAGLHLEEYESNYENYSKPFERSSEGAPTFHVHAYEKGRITGPEEDADGRFVSFSDHESAEESAVFEESQDAKSEQSQYEYEIPSERRELSKTVFDTERHEIQEYRYETNETLEPAKMVGDGSVVSLEKASEERSVSHQMAPQKEKPEISYGTVEQVYLEGSGYASDRTWEEAMEDGAPTLQLEEYHNITHEWTSERAPTFRLHEYELGIMPASDDDADGRSSSSMDFTNDHEVSKEKAVAHEEPSLVDENKSEELKFAPMVEDGPSFNLDKCGNDSTEKEETFCLHESELRTMLEPDEHADRRRKSSEGSELRAVFDEEEQQLMSDSRTDQTLQLHEPTKDRVLLDLEKGENESIKSEDTFEWASERAPTFRLHESEPETRLEPNEDADGRSESSSRGSFNDHVTSKEREINHEEDPRLWTMLEEDTDGRSESSLKSSSNDHGILREKAVTHKDESWLVDDYETKALKAVADNEPSLNLEKCENEKVVLDQTLEPRDDIFKLSLDDTFEQGMKSFPLEMSQDKQVNLRQTFKQGDTEENIPASEGHKSPSKMAEAEEDTMGHHLEHLQIENEKSGLTFEPYSHFYNTTEPSEIVGLRLALYETQTSPLSSPMHTPMGSPLHILMRSPIASPMHSHIVSPMRSPINSSGSLSDVLFFGKKA